MKKTASIILVAVFALVFLAAPNAEAKKCPCKKNSKNSMEKEMDRIRAEQKAYAQNVQSLYNIAENRELRKKLRVSESQGRQLDELERRYAEASMKIRNERHDATSPQQQQYLKRLKEEKLRELSVKAGLKVMDILSKDQVNAYGRQIEMEKMQKKARK